MDAKPGPVRWGPKGAVVGGNFIPVSKNGPFTFGHNGDGVVNMTEVDEAELKEAFQQSKKDRLFLEAHRAEWLEQYPDMYVAVYREKLVGAAPTIKELMAQTLANGVAASECCRAFLDSDPMDLVVPG